MSLPFDISEKLKSVQVRHYVEWLGRDSHCGYGFAFGYDEKSYRLIDELFQMLQDVETDDEDGAKEALVVLQERGPLMTSPSNTEPMKKTSKMELSRTRKSTKTIGSLSFLTKSSGIASLPLSILTSNIAVSF